MSDTKLRKALIKLAYEKPELRDALVPLLKEAGNFDVEAELGDHNVVLRTTFPGYGRMHHIVKNLKVAEKTLRRYEDAMREVLTEAGAYWDQMEPYFAPIAQGDRQIKAELGWSIKGDKLSKDQQDLIKAALPRLKYV